MGKSGRAYKRPISVQVKKDIEIASKAEITKK